jgi:hypothetical protein
MEPQPDPDTGEPRIPPPTLVTPHEPVDVPPPVPIWQRRQRPPTHPRPHERPGSP